MNYYNENAKTFFDGTVHADMSRNYQPFLERLPLGSTILDAGCGSGRDSLAFKNKGYKVKAIDASQELCKLASAYIGEAVEQVRFQEMAFDSAFDGIWAAATLLHVPSDELISVLSKMAKALKSQGVLYASFKYGDFEGMRNGRYFHDLKEEKARVYLELAGFKVEKMWITGDVRQGRGDEMWLNVLASKSS